MATELDMRNQLFSAALGAYEFQGFTLNELEDCIELRCVKCGLVDRFTNHATFKAIQGSCQAHEIKSHGITYVHSLDGVQGSLPEAYDKRGQ